MMKKGKIKTWVEKQFHNAVQSVLGSSYLETVRESFPGAWQEGVIASQADVQTQNIVYACVNLIANDVSKLPVLITRERDGIWSDAGSQMSGVLDRPNSYENRAQFFHRWVTYRLIHGNVYAHKIRDGYGKVTALKLIDPRRVEILVAPDDTLFYRIMSGGHLAPDGTIIDVPQRDIVHDRGMCLNHPLIGISPLAAAALAASQALHIAKNSSAFFSNQSRPSGVLTVPGAISTDTATRLRNDWNSRYSGSNMGGTAVLGDGLKFETMTLSAVDSQLLEQAQFSAHQIASTFGVPGWKIGIDPIPGHNGAIAGQLAYYQTTIQSLLEAIELCLDEALELPATQRTEFDVTELLRVDVGTRYDNYQKAIGAGWMKPNEARRFESLPPVEGGDTPYLQVQNYSLQALAKRDQEAAAETTLDGAPDDAQEGAKQ